MLFLNGDSLHFVQRDLFLSSVVEQGGVWGGVVGDVLGGFQGAVVVEVSRDTGGPEGVVADAGLDAGGLGPPLNHAVGVLLPQGLGGEQAGAAGGRPEKRPVEILGDAGGGEVGVEVQLQVVMTGDCMLLAALLVQTDPAPATLHEVVPDPHTQNGADACEGVNHGADERPVAHVLLRGRDPQIGNSFHGTTGRCCKIDA